MDKTYIDQLLNVCFNVLDIENSSLEDIVHSYETVIHHLFSDNIFNNGRYFVAYLFALTIIDRATNVDKTILRNLLREKLQEKWLSLSNTLDLGLQ